MNWYIVQAYSGFEKKVVESIKDELKKNNLLDNLQEILVIHTKSLRLKKAKELKEKKNFFLDMFY